MKTTKGVAIIGAGFGQWVHLPAFRGLPEYRVLGLCASKPEKSKIIAQEQNLPRVFSDWRQAICSSDVEVVAIAVPPVLQPEMIALALKEKKAIFCEKPLSTSYAEADKLARLAEASGLPNLIDFEFPELETFRKARELLQRGVLGQLRHVQVNWSMEIRAFTTLKDKSNWKTDFSQGGGALYSFASHILHYLEWMLGAREGQFAELSASFSSPRHWECTADSLLRLQLVFASGVPVTVTISSDTYMGKGHMLEFSGDAGTMTLENPTFDPVYGFELRLAMRGQREFELLGREVAPVDGLDGRVWAVSRLLTRLSRWIESGKAECPDLREGARVQSLLESAFHANRDRNWKKVVS